MARMKFLCDADRCIECNACVTACKNENEVPWGINRRRVVTINDGKPGERSVSMACMHCTDAPCAAVCPVTCIFSTDDGVVLHSAIASTPVPSARRSIPSSPTSAHAARWISAPIAPAAAGLKFPAAAKNTQNTAPTACCKASCRCARRCARPSRCLRVTARSSPRSTRNA